MSPLAIDVKEVTKVFGSGHVAVRALDQVDFQVAAGELVMLVGPSGSGKSTLLSIVGCILTATKGEIRLFDHDIGRRRERELPLLRRALIGFVFQSHNLISSLSARHNVALAQRLRGVERATALKEADRLLEQVGLEHLRDHRPSELSVGEVQRVAVARALIGSPPLVLADEPTASLDAASGKRVTDLLRSLARERGSTVLIVTHDQRIFDIADRIVPIEDGRIRSADGVIHHA